MIAINRSSTQAASAPKVPVTAAIAANCSMRGVAVKSRKWSVIFCSDSMGKSLLG